MKLFLDRLFRAFIALLIWPAICIGILIVDMAMIWKMDKPNKPKPVGRHWRSGVINDIIAIPSGEIADCEMSQLLFTKSQEG